MKIEWIRDSELNDDILRKMEEAASACPSCEGINVPCSITVRLCNDEEIARINSECRNISRSTDVLSFPTVRYPAGFSAGSCEKLLKQEYDDETGCCFLGDIVISVPHLYAQAEEYGLTVITDEAKAADAEVVLLAVGEKAYAEWYGDTEDPDLCGDCGLEGNREAIEKEKQRLRELDKQTESEVVESESGKDNEA